MSRTLSVLAVQEQPATLDYDRVEKSLRARLALVPHCKMVIFPELHFCPLDGGPPEQHAERVPGPKTEMLASLAARLEVWLVPGSLYERTDDGSIYNTAIAISPEGRLVATYRKCFPWRPFERARPGTQFTVFDIPGCARVGLSICYDLWFPEVARHLAWMGAEVIVQPTLTTTSDRWQELVLVQATAIVNQLFVVNLNAAAPPGRGRSLIVGPEGRTRVEAGEAPAAMTDVLDLDEVWRVRRFGTAGLNRVWDQFEPSDEPLPLPLYSGRIDPARWRVERN